MGLKPEAQDVVEVNRVNPYHPTQLFGPLGNRASLAAVGSSSG